MWQMMVEIACSARAQLNHGVGRPVLIPRNRNLILDRRTLDSCLQTHHRP
jgi:hypothetical protein